MSLVVLYMVFNRQKTDNNGSRFTGKRKGHNDTNWLTIMVGNSFASNTNPVQNKSTCVIGLTVNGLRAGEDLSRLLENQVSELKCLKSHLPGVLSWQSHKTAALLSSSRSFQSPC